MIVVEMEQAEQDLSTMLRRVELGESFIIARDGKPFGTLQPIGEHVRSHFRIGVLEGRGIIPDDIKGPYETEINEMFYGE